MLSLVTNDATFHRRETAALADAGVERTTLAVPGDPRGRSVGEYLRFVPQVLAEARGDYDLVHANYGLTAPMALAQRELPVVSSDLPVVLSLWGSDLLGEYGWLGEACARYCDEVVVMTDEMAARLDRPVHVIPHGIDAERFAPRPTADARERVGWSPDARHVLFPYAPDRPIKDFPRAARVVEAVRERVDRPVELHVLGGVDHAEVATYMNAADALLLTSRREGSPNVVKEAMGCNLPVIAADVGDVRERLDGVSPSAVHDADEQLATSLAAVLADPRRSNGRNAVADLRVERTAERVRAVYERALDPD